MCDSPLFRLLFGVLLVIEATGVKFAVGTALVDGAEHVTKGAWQHIMGTLLTNIVIQLDHFIPFQLATCVLLLLSQYELCYLHLLLPPVLHHKF